MKAAGVGAAVTLVLVLVVVLVWGGAVVWARALHGQIAYEIISQQLQAQQAPPSKATPPPSPKP